MSDNRTTELREKLTELDVKWWPMRNNGYYEDRDTEFVVNGKKYTAHEWGDGLAVYNLTPEQAIAATLGDDDYECRMDELLCRLTNGKWSKSRSYSVDFMVSCVDEAYEDAALGEKRTCETCDELGNVDSFINHLIQAERHERTCTNVNTDGYEYRFNCSSCGHSVIVHDCSARLDELPNYCSNCGAKVLTP